jgi:hypothetical protein
MGFTLGPDRPRRVAIPGHPAKWPEPATAASSRLGRLRADRFRASSRLGRLRADRFRASSRLGRLRADRFRVAEAP